MTTATPTYCRICEAACGLVVEPSASGGPPRIRPDRDHPVSRGFVCAKGTRFGEVAFDPERLLHPMRRGADGALRQVGWDEALDDTAAALRGIVDRHGPHAVGLFFGNPMAFNSLGAVGVGAFARALGTRNVFSSSSQDCNNKFHTGKLVHGAPGIHPIPDLERCDLAVLFGTNPAVSQSSFVHLSGGSRALDDLRERGGEVWLVDPRRTESAARWGGHLPVRPGSDVWLILAWLGLLGADFAGDDRVTGLDRMLELARSVTPERAAAMTGLPAALIRQLAERLREGRTAFHMSVGVNMGPFGTLAYVALQALMLVSGNLDRAGGNVFHPVAPPFSRVANRLGIGASTARSRVGDFPAVFDGLPGGVLADEILTDGPERIRAMVVVAGDPVHSIPGTGRLREAFESLEFVVTLDMFENATGRAADVLLPMTSWLERWDVAITGMLLQHAPRLQITAAAMPARGECRPETPVLADLSLRMGRPLFGSRLAARALRSIRRDGPPRLTKVLARLGWGKGLPFPTPKPGRYLGRGPLMPGRKMRLWPEELDGEPARLAAWEAAHHEVPDGFTLLCRRRRIGHNSWLHGGTREVPERERAAWMHPEDLVALGLGEDAVIRVWTQAGELRIPAAPNMGVARRTVVIPHGLPDVNVNAIIPSGADFVEPVSGQHFMTGIPCEVEAVEVGGERVATG